MAYPILTIFCHVQSKIIMNMNKQEIIKSLTPESGFSDLLSVYINWTGVGFITAIVAERLDHVSGITYAAYYTESLNSAIGVKFWALISIIGLLLLCLCIPFIYLSERQKKLQSSCDRFQFFSYGFFLVAFDEGALILGILIANLIYGNERAELLANQSFLFTEASILSVIALVTGNSILWLLGESLYNRQNKRYSGVIKMIISAPLKYSLPAYLIVTTVLVMLVFHQS